MKRSTIKRLKRQRDERLANGLIALELQDRGVHDDATAVAVGCRPSRMSRRCRSHRYSH